MTRKRSKPKHAVENDQEEFKDELPPRKRAKRRVFKEESESAYDLSSSDFEVEKNDKSEEKPQLLPLKPICVSVGVQASIQKSVSIKSESSERIGGIVDLPEEIKNDG